MTRKSGFKRLVRERMARTGERYTTARRQLLGGRIANDDASGIRPDVHGINAATTAFRILLGSAGVRLSEGELLLAGGGIGIGVFSFHYPEFSSLFIAGRHLWHDDLAYLQGLGERLAVPLEIRETGSRKQAEKTLFEMLEKGPVIAFVDLATLGHRGGVEAYYVVTVLEANEGQGTALIADLADRPIEVRLETLAEARARHRKFKNRLVRIDEPQGEPPISAAVDAGLEACAQGLVSSPMKGAGSNFTLESLDLLSKRMRSEGKESWAQQFPPGPRLWTALSSLYEYIEHYGSGGGLLRPFFAESLAGSGSEAASVAPAYASLGERWSALARTALDPTVFEFAELARLIDESYGFFDASADDAAEELESLRENRRSLVRGDFPLSPADARRHIERLAEAVEELAAGEKQAHALLSKLTA